MVYGYTKTTEYTKFILKTKEINCNLQKGASILMAYGYMKTTEYTRFNFRKLQISILTYKKGLPYWWYTGIRRLPKYTKFIYKTKEINFNSQKGASILMVYRYTKTTEYTRFNFRKLHISILTYKKGLPYWWYTGIRRLPKYTKSI